MKAVPDAALALVSAGRALQTLRLGEWAVPVGELRSGGESVFCSRPHEFLCVARRTLLRTLF